MDSTHFVKWKECNDKLHDVIWRLDKIMFDLGDYSNPYLVADLNDIKQIVDSALDSNVESMVALLNNK